RERGRIRGLAVLERERETETGHHGTLAAGVHAARERRGSAPCAYRFLVAAGLLQGTEDSPSRSRPRPPFRPTFRLRVLPLETASTLDAPLLGASRILFRPCWAVKRRDSPLPWSRASASAGGWRSPARRTGATRPRMREA